MKIRNMILFPAAVALWACTVQAAAPGAAWTVKQNFPVGRDCRVNASAGDSLGNLYLAGSIDNGIYEDFFVAKVDWATDSLAWTAVYNGPDNNIDQATGCSLDSLGNLYVTGFSHNGTDFDILTIKYDAASGAMGWVKRYNTGLKTNEYASSCAADRFGNLIVAGTCNEDTLYEAYNHEEYHMLAVKYDGTDGDTIWSRHLDLLPDSLNEANDCCVDDSGNAYLSGYSAVELWTPSGLALRLNSIDGGVEWVKRFSQTEGMAATCCATLAGGLYVAGIDMFSSCFAIKLNASNGDTVWTKNIAFNGMMSYDCGVGLDSSLIVVTSKEYQYHYSNEYGIIKYDTDTGDTLWARTYLHKNSNTLRSLVLDEPGIVTVLSSGEMGELPGQAHTGMFAAKHSAETGFLLDSCSYGQSSPGGGWNFAYDCAVAGNNGPVVVGSAGTFYAAIMHDPSDGHLVWEKRDPDGYDPQHTTNSKATGVVQGGDHIYTTGHAGAAGILTYNFDRTTGDTLWAAYNSYGLNLPVNGSCALDQWGYLFVTSNSLDGYYDIISNAVKLNWMTGDTIWASKSQYLVWSTSCTVDSLGSFYDLGASYGWSGYIIVKHDNATGDTLWSKAFNLFGTGLEDAQCVCYSNGYLYVAGATYNGSDLDYFLAKHDTAGGDTVWCRLFDSPFGLEDRALSCAADDSGFIYLTGSSYNGSDYDIWTMKCTPDGDTLWSVRYDGPDNLNDFGRGCCVDSLGYFYVTGFSATGSGYDMVTIKYNTAYTGVAGGPLTPKGGKYFLGSVYPNPCLGGKVSLRYELPAAARAAFTVYNIAGQLVKKLDQGQKPAGIHQFAWDGTDRQGARVSSGVYLLWCDLGGLSATRKVLVVR